MLETKHLSYKIGTTYLLQDVSIQCEPGKIHIIIGPNGAGKSTLIKLICGQLKPSEGTILLDNQLLETYSIAQLAKQRAVLSQHIDMAFPMKVSEVVMMGRYPHFTGSPTSKDQQAVREAMEYFHVASLMNRSYVTLSGGEKQRVHFARVAAQIWYPTEDSCRYLFLDEPLTFLDIYHQFHFMHQLIEMIRSKQMVVIGVLHDLNLTAKFADQIILMHEGKCLAQGNKFDVFTKDRIRQVYQLSPTIIKDGNNLQMFF